MVLTIVRPGRPPGEKPTKPDESEPMPEVDLADAAWIDRPPTVVAAVLADPARWPGWWPGLVLEVAELRGPKGVRWRVLRAARGRASGSLEVWLQPVDGGTVAHHFLRLSGARGPLRRRERARLGERYRRRARAVLWSIADEVDPGRLARVAAPPTRLPRTLRADGRIP